MLPPAAAAVTSDLDEARRLLEQAYAPNELRADGSRGDFMLDLISRTIPMVDIGRASFGGGFRMDVPGSRSSVVVITARHGGVTIGYGSRSIRVSAGKAAVLPPEIDLSYRDWEPGSEFATLRLEDPVMAQFSPLVTGTSLPALREPVLVDLASISAQSLAWAMELAVRELRRPSGLLDHAPIAEPLSELAVSGLLLAVADHDDPVASGAWNALVKRAIAAVEDDDACLFSATELAKSVSVSLRTLQAAFRHELRTTPTDYQRRLRVTRAHRDLEQLDCTQTTAEAIAHRWGFTNYGRFVRQHREMYGVSPAETLRRSR